MTLTITVKEVKENLGLIIELGTYKTPSAPATEYTIEQIAEIDNRIRKERKAEREQVLNAFEEFLNSDDHLSLFKWEVREQIRSLRGGATDEGGERR